ANIHVCAGSGARLGTLLPANPKLMSTLVPSRLENPFTPETEALIGVAGKRLERWGRLRPHLRRGGSAEALQQRPRPSGARPAAT
ncbi:MAG: hypothetical protein ACRDKL_10925, partial [Solirubrobacteraceae bacterium]